MKFAYIGTYVPRECGIGTFTQNLFLSMTEAKSKTARHEGIVVAMDDNVSILLQRVQTGIARKRMKGKV